jgi:ABC-type Mn2+/Zn2+ transport system permease subunit
MQAFRWLVDYQFARHAMLTGIAVSTLCSLLSVLVVLKRMAFIGEGLSHAGFGGMGTAVFLGLVGFRQDLVVLLFCVAMAAMIGAMTRRKHIEPDSAIGIALVAAMAWGIFMSDLRRTQWYRNWFGPPGVAPNMEGLLFGSLLSVSRDDMYLAFAVGAAILLLLGLFLKEIIFYCFDEEGSKVFGVRAGAIHYLLPVIISVTIVLTIRLAGFVLVSAMLVIPGATAMLLSRRLQRVIALSWTVGVGGTAGGILLSLQLGNVSSGACIVGVLCAIFALVFAVTSAAKARVISKHASP